MDGIGELLIRNLRWERAEMEEMLVRVREDLDGKGSGEGKRYYWQMYVFSGHKPE